MKAIYSLLHVISKYSIYAGIFSILFLLQKYTIGLIPVFRDLTIFNKLYLHEIIFIITSLIITVRYFKASSPYEKKLEKC
ncbi:MAG: hypothetical protein GX336_01135 [Halanaerobiaceae bacterium]|nr:hypothetical protein [Halanaerobiaceae bacterium]